MKNKYIYIFTNPAMPQWIKVGKADDISKRLKSLYKSTCIPTHFECYAYLEVPADDVYAIEQALHIDMEFSKNKKKEFFKMKPEQALKYFINASRYNKKIKVVTNPDFTTAEEKQKRNKTTFALLQIPVGSVLVYKKNKKIKCTVMDKKNKVKYNNQITTLSQIACDLQKNRVNGFDFFILEKGKFKDETLWERRLRLEDE